MASVFPAFCTGAVAVQLRDDLGLADSAIGIAMAGFFTGSGLASIAGGRLAERIGPRRSILLALSVTASVETIIVLTVERLGALVALLVVAGAVNALTQVSVNKLLAGRLPAAGLGFGMAIKQSGMPAATLAGGAAVPLLAVEHGWRWPFVVGVGFAIAALVVVATATRTDLPPAAHVAPGTPDLAPTLLRHYALTGVFAAGAAGAVVAYLVVAAESAGIAPGPAGWLLSIGSALGIASRLWQGRQADRGRLVPVRRVAAMLLGGGVGVLVFALDRPAAYLLGLLPAFGLGWAWPGLMNLSIVRRNPSAPAAATGVSQTGIYIGALSGPLLAGVLFDRSPPLMWLCVGASLLVAGVSATRLARRLDGE